VYGGFIPEAVELTWRMEGGRFIGEVTTDVPFGTFDVPVVLDGVETWVVVTDGRGRLEVARGRPGTVALDPDGRILTRRRVVREE
ncbi:MAG: hypothetical protein ACI8PZ_004837, partial [Myxococcota bacterium]